MDSEKMLEIETPQSTDDTMGLTVEQKLHFLQCYFSVVSTRIPAEIAAIATDLVTSRRKHSSTFLTHQNSKLVSQIVAKVLSWAQMMKIADLTEGILLLSSLVHYDEPLSIWYLLLEHNAPQSRTPRTSRGLCSAKPNVKLYRR